MGDSKRTELLAPAGSLDAGYAAFYFGADAVYTGLRRFSARADAENLSLEDLDNLTAYAHSLTPRRRVFVTLNTLAQNRELPEVIEVLVALPEVGVDAVIVQDLGVVRLVRAYAPQLRLHGSTQMAIHNREGVEALQRLGFARVTLARELTLDDVHAAASVPGIEVETFIHGALCYGYSGLCLLSSHLCGRSGNRGRCAYPCRDGYALRGADSAPVSWPAKGRTGAPFLLSMKDLAVGEDVLSLRDAGAAALKIEGRMKTPLYVAAVTHYYRRLLDGPLRGNEKTELEAELRSIFSRPWTRLYLRSRRTPDVVAPEAVGHRGLPIGEVIAIVRPEPGKYAVLFRTRQALERHDGVQVDIPGLAKAYGFAAAELWCVTESGGGRGERWQGEGGGGQRAGRGGAAPDRPRESAGTASGGEARFKPMVTVPAGAQVAVGLPPEHPQIPVGAVVCWASSQAARRHYQFTRPKPGLHRNLCPLHVRVTVGRDTVSARAEFALAGQGDRKLNAEARVTSGAFSVADAPERTRDALRTAFAKMGGTRFTLGTLEEENPERLFVPISLLNQCRRDLVAAAEQAWQAALAARTAVVVAETAGGLGADAEDGRLRTAGDRLRLEDRRIALRRFVAGRCGTTARPLLVGESGPGRVPAGA
ncbi:MAG: hypothetical protein A3K18_09450 [Lentisphaerae bacterium RIFOXYA12_64_32]|nr:MAG: hypothetical protein A3K18_09450 [Lentisphaerae bacterium RIFOXYA12_64_32]